MSQIFVMVKVALTRPKHRLKVTKLGHPRLLRILSQPRPKQKLQLHLLRQPQHLPQAPHQCPRQPHDDCDS